MDRFIKENNAFVHDNNEKFTGNHMKKLPSESELALFRQKLFNSLSHSPIEIGDIVEQLEIPINILSYLLLELELAGKISRLSNNKIYLIS